MEERIGLDAGGNLVRLSWEGSQLVEVAPVQGEPGRVFLLPLLVDIQVNGYAGGDFNAPDVRPEEVRAITRRLWREGVGYYCPTVTTGSRERMLRSVRTIAAAWREFPEVADSVLGVHVEGPFISPEDGPRGAHPREHVRPPSYQEYLDWQEAAEGRVRIVTLSPEWPEAISFIGRVAGEGVVVAIGHTAAEPERIREAVEAGARLSTHLGNGAHALLPRHPNYIWEQLAEDRLWASFIADGHHLPFATLKAMLRAKGPERSVLISDAVRLAGMKPGRYPRLQRTGGGAAPQRTGAACRNPLPGRSRAPPSSWRCQRGTSHGVLPRRGGADGLFQSRPVAGASGRGQMVPRGPCQLHPGAVGRAARPP
ncbi:MAG: hypothetical protein KatS3mg115_0955 [Candidatus Poribacteria bacterium]|nr:MAG: hypothetical protein KatS3mg115_0955 [Candidatus Poribacteria bacterium]